MPESVLEGREISIGCLDLFEGPLWSLELLLGPLYPLFWGFWGAPELGMPGGFLNFPQSGHVGNPVLLVGAA